jgi:hypothetical protein
MGLLAQISRTSGPTRGGPPYPSLRVWLVGYLWYQTSSVGLGDFFFEISIIDSKLKFFNKDSELSWIEK